MNKRQTKTVKDVAASLTVTEKAPNETGAFTSSITLPSNTSNATCPHCGGALRVFAVHVSTTGTAQPVGIFMHAPGRLAWSVRCPHCDRYFRPVQRAGLLLATRVCYNEKGGS